MSGSEEQKKAFLSQPHFAVVGASKDETKFGTKVSMLALMLPDYSDLNWFFMCRC